MALIAPSSTISPKSLAIFESKNAANKKKFFVHMVSNGYAGRGASRNEKIYKRLASCLVVPPPTGRKPKALIKFLGGAFVGAAPEVTYSYLMELLAKEGYLIVSVPYNVTFDHEGAAKEVYERFHGCMEMLFSSGLPYASIAASELVNLPLYSVGHSNGALLQLLVGCYFEEKIPKANAVVSFNNRPASEAVPYFEQLGPAVSQVMPLMEASPFYSMARDVSGNAWKTLLDTAGTLVQEYDQEIMTSLNKFVDQLPSVMGQVSQGTSEFRPTPSENRLFFKKSYNVPHTLLVKFSNDAFDETDTVEQILRPRVDSVGGTLKKVTLSGNHLTPCVQDLKWAVGHQYTPADALAQSLKSISLSDTKVLAKTISDWFQDLQP
ncbi:putative alpha/Beta hydrolase [Dioscorea sansibarensis]